MAGYEESGWKLRKVKVLLRDLIDSKIIYQWDEAVLYSFLLRKGLLNLSSNRHQQFFKKTTDSNLAEFIDFFHKLRYAKQSDFTIVNSSEATLAGMEAREIDLYEQQENVLDPKSDLKVMRVYAFDINSHKGYAIRYYSEPGLFNRYLPIAQKMIDSFEINFRKTT